MKNSTSHRYLKWIAAFLLVWRTVEGAPIPGLFNTGVNTNGAVLSAGQIDPHYKLVASDDPAYPGPNAVTINAGFPVPPWVAEGPDSRWIAPRAQQATGNAEGSYTYRTTFNLTGLDPNKAMISGNWAVDNSGVDILLNGASLGISNGSGFTSFAEFTIASGFVAGTNTLDFVVSNAPATPNPTGLRVEMHGTVELPAEAPSIFKQPQARTVVRVGDDASWTVVADGTPPLKYQWRLNGVNLAGANEATLLLSNIKTNQEGSYTVIISNSAGSVTSTTANLVVLEVIPGLFNTGVGNSQTVLDDLAVDPHYKLVTNPDGPSTDAIVHDSTVFPIVSGPWVANTETSKWIAPRGDTAQAAGGNYVYRLTFDLSGFDPATALITGRWATDNVASDVRLNGISTRNRNDAQFASYTTFTITNGFLSGTNTLDFLVNNAGSGPTGLRVDSFAGGAKKKAAGPAVSAPTIIRQPQSLIGTTGESIIFAVVADGTPPLAYQWRFNSVNIAGATSATLSLANLALNAEGSYSVTVTNSAGSVTSAPAALTVLDAIAGLFNTGFGADGKVLADLAVDSHYKIVTNADSASTDAFVHDSTVFPIINGPWVANTQTSKWIAPRGDTAQAAGGDYVYRLMFDLTSFDPATVVVNGNWATDNLGLDLLLNGVSTGIRNDGQFTSYTSFSITNGFKAGTNTLDYSLNNASAGYTGLRVENLRGGGKRSAAGGARPALSVSLARDGTIALSWPTSASGFVLESTDSLAPANWKAEGPAVAVTGDRNTVALAASGRMKFFRLRK